MIFRILWHLVMCKRKFSLRCSWSPNSTDLYFWYSFVDNKWQQTNTKDIAGQSAIGDEEDWEKLEGNPIWKKEEILVGAGEEYIWKLTTKLPKLCQRFKKYSPPENLTNMYLSWISYPYMRFVIFLNSDKIHAYETTFSDKFNDFDLGSAKKLNFRNFCF